MNIQFNAGVIKDELLYFSAKNYNGLFSLNLSNGSVRFLDHFPKDNLWTEYMHQYAFDSDCYIYFIPYEAHYISKFDIRNQEINCIEIYSKYDNASVACAVEYQKKYILVPRELNKPILVFNLENDEIEEISIKSSGINLDSFYCDMYGATIIGDDLLVAVYNTDLVLRLSLKNYSWDTIHVPNTNNSAITFWDNKIWLVSSDGKEINCINEKYELIKNYKLLGKSERPFESWINDKKGLYLCGCLDDKILRYDETADTWVAIDFNNVKRINKNWAFGCGYSSDEDNIYIFPSAGASLIRLNNNENSILDVDFYDSELYEKIEKEKAQYHFGGNKTEVIVENQYLGLKDMIVYLSK